MTWTPYALPPLLAAAITSLLCLYVGLGPSGAVPRRLLALLSAISFWCLLYAAEVVLVGHDAKLLAAKLQYLGIAAVPPAAFVLIAGTMGGWPAFGRPRFVALTLPSLAMLGLVFTNAHHGWVWSESRVVRAGFDALVVSHGPAFRVFSAWSYLLLLGAFGLAVASLLRPGARGGHRGGQAAWVMAALAAPWLGNVLYNTGVGPGAYYDLTCVGFAVTGVALAYGILLERGFLEIVRVAHREIVESMRDPVLVADPTGRIVYANDAARRTLRIPFDGRPAPPQAALAALPAVATLLASDAPAHGEVELDADEGRPEPAIFDARLAPLRPRGQTTGSRVLVLRDVTERRLAERRINTLAYFDGLTGLANRERFQELLSHTVATARRRSQLAALLFIDLDRFKRINDTYGHSEGDRLIQEVGRRLQGVVRFTDSIGRGSDEMDIGNGSLVSRLGGDEFTVALTEISHPLDAAAVARRFLSALERPLPLSASASATGVEIVASASIGIALFPHDGEDAEALLRSADTAMYHAKRRGGACFDFFDPAMNEAVSRRTRIEGLLRGALDRDELTLHYQPVRRIGTGEVVAAEALLRWQLPDGEDLTPDEFVPVAEEAGLIAPLGEWVLRRACLQHRTWTDRGLRSLRLSVNVSTHQLRRADFANLVRETLRETGMSPGSLDLEITESAVLEHDEVTGATLAALANLGVGLTLDDFGTGYSSLSYLRRVSFDRLKIDRVFVTDPSQGVPDLALAAAVVTLAHGLRMQVVAEGVETRAQHDALAGVGCDQVQGYLLGQPAPPEEFERYLASDKPAAS